jgi:hypothetical protein
MVAANSTLEQVRSGAAAELGEAASEDCLARPTRHLRLPPGALLQSRVLIFFFAAIFSNSLKILNNLEITE